MTDFENKGTPDQEAPQEPQPAPEEPQQAPAQEEAPQANPYASQVPHLTFDPNEPDPFQGDPFHSPEPPRAPEPPQPEPEYQQPPQNQGYGAPQYGAPPYGAGQYQPPQYTQPPQQNYYQPQYVVPQYNVPPAGYNQKSRLAAGLLGILLGTLGVHNFYLGFTTRGVVQLLVSIIGHGGHCRVGLCRGRAAPRRLPLPHVRRPRRHPAGLTSTIKKAGRHSVSVSFLFSYRVPRPLKAWRQ